jgi:hypothetical protein
MGKTTELRRQIKAEFVPFMIAKGFEIDSRHAPQFLCFRRVTPDVVYVFDIQWDKYGSPRFKLNFGKCCGAGTIVFEEHVHPADIFSWQTPNHGTLAPGSHISTSGWFRHDRPLLSRLIGRSKFYPAAEVIALLEQLFLEVEAFWYSGTIGDHIRLMPADQHVKDACSNRVEQTESQ